MTLQLETIEVRLGAKRVVSALNLTLAKGKLIALTGPNGAGKSSLMRAIAGLLPYNGRIQLAQTDLATCSLAQRARLIAYLPQMGRAAWPMPCRQIIAMGRLSHGHHGRRLNAHDMAAIERAMYHTDTQAFADTPITHLSGGEQARVFLARALAVEAPLTLVDEPTANLDPKHRLMVLSALRRRAHGEAGIEGQGVIAILHDLAEAAAFADEVVVMDQGQIVAQAPPQQALSADILSRIFGVEYGGMAGFWPIWKIDALST